MFHKIIFVLILLAISTISFGQFERYSSFEQLDSLSRIYFQNNYLDSAILAVEYGLDKYPEYDEKATFILGFLYVQGGHDSKALSNWNYGHEKGYCYGLERRHYKNHFNDNENFKVIAKTDKKIGKKLDSNSHIEYEITLPNHYTKNKKYPLVFVFHGNGRNIQKAKHNWRSEILSNEVIVVYLQSYIHVSSYDFKWILADDRTSSELKQIYEEVVKNNSINKDKIILAGMSAGGMVAIDYGFKNIIPCSDFLLNCPVIPDVDSLLITDYVSKNKKIAIITGENDFALDRQKEMIEIIKVAEGQAEIKIIDGLGHQFPENFPYLLDEYLKEMIE